MGDVTPPRKTQPPISSDTVPRPRATAQSAYRSGDLTQGRAAVLSDLERYLTVPYHTFVRSVFGDVVVDVAHMRQSLIDADLLTPTPLPQWTQFPNAPASSNEPENVVFGRLLGIVSNVFESSAPCNVAFQIAPSKTPLSERGNTSRPDAYVSWTRAEPSGDPHWWDIAVPCEFKKKDSRAAKKDNEEKIIWSLHSIMREDPRRRFALGITIEDRHLRIWYHGRAFVAASEPLDFMQEIDDVIRLFHAIASKDEDELGWDPTIERILDGGDVQYRFTIGGEVFTTISPLATYGADAMVGRATRVYKAKDEGGNVVAVKDSWRDHDRDLEGTILAKIFRDIEARFGKEEATEARKYFVGVRVSEDVVISGKADATLEFAGLDALEWKEIDLDPELSKALHTPSAGHTESIHSPTVERRKVGTRDASELPKRVHARTVFTDVGEPLKDITDLHDRFSCLSDARKALYYMHMAGWVHRDFSVANALHCQQVGKLSDLEYAKDLKLNPGFSHDVRTGTMHFMAVEVENQRYIFRPAPDPHDYERDEPPFRMNYLHDLESAWWAGIWILLMHTDANSDPATPPQLGWANAAFPSAIGQASRHYFFNQEAAHATRHLLPTFRKPYVALVAHATELREHYQEVEKSSDIQFGDGLVEKAHDQAQAAYSRIVGLLAGSKIPLRFVGNKKRSPEGLPTGQERKRARLDG